ncbi:uncharacterized protein MONBRDRAFT_6133 [Monosiga brevicollis MX1]|uniref:AMP-dependent synthetase/ligase domain-containing protein n=1 Tax=Monosiga brevicollis TaxID=81824 RepID=A9USX4_MONBE|nr:uncharacterized protein MONBRDRAFT_6133 [Monosiga brevicollis MX1]EDQ91142.1 predicted protein [Monosiga brevicollis MX1]|eukprot:XP_001743564.1 hypothetical protein [Monosiga brevicollis MX1]
MSDWTEVDINMETFRVERIDLKTENDVSAVESFPQLLQELMLLLRSMSDVTCIGLDLSSTPHLVAGVAACFELAVPYVIVSGMPSQRREYILQQIASHTLEWHAGETAWSLTPRPEVPDISLPPNTCHVYYTSGSTGRPKGVVTSRLNMLEYIRGHARLHGYHATSRVLLVSAPLFDPFVGEILTARHVGATLLVARDTAAMLGQLAAVCQHQRFSHVCSTPAVWGTVDSALQDPECTIMLGGERMPASLQARWCTYRLFNIYGTTECTVYQFSCRLHDATRAGSIGQPYPGVLYRIKSENQALSDPSEGELVLGGTLVAQYLDHDGGFFTEEDGSRWYSTGDVVCRSVDCHLDLLGRLDDQPVLNSWLALHLPPAFLASTIVFISDWPLTATGKRDKAQLRASVAAAQADAQKGSQPARELTPVEGYIGDIWAMLLGTPCTRPDFDFWVSGGDSLGAMRLVTRLRKEVAPDSQPERMALGLFEGPFDPQAVLKYRTLERYAAFFEQALRDAGLEWSVAETDSLTPNNLHNSACPLQHVLDRAASHTQGHLVLPLLFRLQALDCDAQLFDVNGSVSRHARKQSPLHAATLTGNALLVQQLLSAGAKVNLPNANNVMPAHLAAQTGAAVLETLLVRALLGVEQVAMHDPT